MSRTPDTPDTHAALLKQIIRVLETQLEASDAS